MKNPDVAAVGISKPREIDVVSKLCARASQNLPGIPGRRLTGDR